MGKEKNVARAVFIIVLHAIVQFILLEVINKGGLRFFNGLLDLIITMFFSILLLICTIRFFHFKLSQRSRVLFICMTGIFICLFSICFLVLTSSRGQWTTIAYSNLGGENYHDKDGFRKEILWLLSAIHFFIALLVLNKINFTQPLYKGVLYLLLAIYIIMYIDFAIQPKPKDGEFGEDIFDYSYTHGNTKKGCYYKYRFMFIKFRKQCN